MKRQIQRVALALVTLALFACGGGGGGGGENSGGVTIISPAPQLDTTAPSGYSIAFDADLVDEDNEANLGFTVSNAESGTLYSYNITSTAGGDPVSGSGSAAQSTITVIGIDVSGLEDGTLSVAITLRDSAGNTGAPATATVEKLVNVGYVEITGQLTFDLITQVPRNGALDYSNIQPTPIRGIIVEAVDQDGLVVDNTQSDEQGHYSLKIPPNITAQVRARAQMRSSKTASWDIKVTDNTRDNALYILAGSFNDTGSEDSNRDLHAGSGWTGANYDEPRSAAPFSILYYLYDALQQLVLVKQDLALGDLELRWSVNNNAAEGALADGDLGSSFYNGRGAIYLLGKENSDTEEYDPFVIIHEFTHFLTDTLSRDDSIGGSHNVRQFLDFRVAYSEGLASAIAAMLLADTLYRDNGGFQQQGTLAFFDIEENPTIDQGWFVESSVYSILYDIYDSASDGADTISLGLEPVFHALTDPELSSSPWFTSIYSFIDVLQGNLTETGVDTSGVQSLMQAQQIFGTGKNGLGEENSGGIESSLPVYKEVTVSGAPTVLCSSDEYGIYNKFGNRAFGSVAIEQAGTYNMVLDRVSGNRNRDPDFLLHSLGSIRRIQFFEVEARNLETGTAELSPGQYILEAFDYFNTEKDLDDGKSGTACYEFTIVPG